MGNDVDQGKVSGRTFLAWRKFRRHTLSIYGGLIVLLLYFCALFADFIAPYDYGESAREKSFFWPTKIHWRTAAGTFCRPYVLNGYKLYDRDFTPHYVEGTETNSELIAKHLDIPRADVDTRVYPIRLFVRRPSAPHKLFWLFHTNRRLFGIDGEGAEASARDPHRPMVFLLGSDQLGRCVLSRILYGSRVSLSIGIVAVCISFSIGMLVGGISGYFKGTTDVALQRLCEMMMMVPGFYLLLALRSSFPPDLSSTQVYFAVVTILAFIGWAGMARVIRGMVLGVTRNEYVMAARALGAGNLRIIVRHVLPSTISYAIVSATMSIPAFMLGETGLSFIGLGIQDPEASWGNMLNEARDLMTIRMHPWLLAPGLMIFITVIAFQFLGDGLRDAFDPRTIVAAKEDA
ncbi:MAG: ABC transporter permease [Lentisphaeria bacterium]|nr:ABC transporter permease [Lentisphaeria bacterium]